MRQADVAGATRFFDGLLFESRMTDATDMGVHYRLILRPWFLLLAQNLDIRIFQSMSVVDILKKVIAESGYDSDFAFDATGSYPARTYCVQYRESDFNLL